jgi:hypothetical protein
MIHQKTDGVAVFAAAKTMEKLLGGADAEAGGFLTVEGAQAHEVGAPLLELDIAPHDVHHIGARQKFLYE